MSGPLLHGGAARAPLLGHNLVRLLYLDEAGSDFKAPTLVVAGVLVHGDIEWPEIDRRMEALVQKYIPEPDRLGFVFHAADIFQGNEYFDRNKPEWPRERRNSLLADLATIIEEMHLPVVAGGYQKAFFGEGALSPEDGPGFKGKLIHNIAVIDCLARADSWLAKFAPQELAAVVHEDGTPAKRLIKHSVRLARSAGMLEEWGADAATQAEVGLPLRRIIDTVHFADKPDARPLQLADLCAFTLGRVAKNLPIQEYVFDVIWRHLRWITGAASVPSADVRGEP